MKDWYESLEAREQLFVAVAIVVVACAAVYALVWIPLDNGHKTLSANVADWERSLSELRPLKGLQSSHEATSRRQDTNNQSTPVVIVDQSLRARGMDRSLKRSQPTTGDGIRVEFENVAFDDLVLWLGDLSMQYQMHVSAGTFSAASRAGPGRINATLTLERAL